MAYVDRSGDNGVGIGANCVVLPVWHTWLEVGPTMLCQKCQSTKCQHVFSLGTSLGHSCNKAIGVPKVSVSNVHVFLLPTAIRIQKASVSNVEAALLPKAVGIQMGSKSQMSTSLVLWNLHGRFIQQSNRDSKVSKRQVSMCLLISLKTSFCHSYNKAVMVQRCQSQVSKCLFSLGTSL